MNLFWRLFPISLIACTVDDLARGELVPANDFPELDRVARQLLAYRGKYVIFGFEEFPFEELLKEGKLLQPDHVQHRSGRQSECHANSARLWKRAKTTTSIMTGFGFTAEGDRWRRHSWLLHKDGHIIETTVERDLYFGIILDRAQADAFVDENL